MVASDNELVTDHLDTVSANMWAKESARHVSRSYIPDMYMVIPSTADDLVLVEVGGGKDTA